VASRRVRATLRTFAPLLDQGWSEDLQGELRWLADCLSEARDAEVLLARLLDDVDRLPTELVRGPVKARLEEHVGGRLATGLQHARAALNDHRYLRLVDRLVDAAWSPRCTEAADAPAREALPPLVASAWRRLDRRVGRLEADLAAARKGRSVPEEDYHRARIAAKQARYAAESVSPVLGKRATKFAELMESVQEMLGEHQDAVVARDTLGQVASGSRASTAAFTLGVLFARQDAAAERARQEFLVHWPTVAQPRHRRWLGSR
jgi:CHAD domain-containing protein